MSSGRLGSKMRLLRVRLGWRQTDLATCAGVSRGVVSLIERGQHTSVTIGAMDRVADALNARLKLEVQWSGAELDRLLDAGHAALAAWLAEFLRRPGWEVRAEVSFNHYGDRGRYDLLAFHGYTRVLLVVEVKTAIGDLQDLLGRLDVKVRLGRATASSMGWRPTSVVALLLLAEGDTNRRRVRDHASLLHRLSLRGRDAAAWLRQPSGAPPSGLLLFRKLAYANHRSLIRVGRVRKAHAQTTAAHEVAGADSRPIRGHSANHGDI